jgi:dipeptidyl aminopeptidase/acylaminoacyl peptidase
MRERNGGATACRQCDGENRCRSVFAALNRLLAGTMLSQMGQYFYKGRSKQSRVGHRFVCVVAGIGAHLMMLPTLASADDETRFLEFPIVTQTVAARNADTFAWLVRQGDQSKVMVAHGPKFAPLHLHSRDDHDGESISDIAVSPDGRVVAFVTGTPYAQGQAHNPSGLTNAPAPTLWIVPTQSGASVRRVAAGTGPVFAGAARLIYRHGHDLHVLRLEADANDQTVLAGGAAFDDIRVSPDEASIAFVHDRGGYAFLGVQRLGENRVSWLVTGPDRVASPVWSPDGRRLAYVQRAGREHDRIYDLTESEPLSIHVVDVHTGETRMLWQSPGKAAVADLEDPDSILRWAGNDRLVFYSEHDGWARLYAQAIGGDPPVPLSAARCEVAESEQVSRFELFVIHNCDDRHRRQAWIVDVRMARHTAVAMRDTVLANASATTTGFVAFAGGDAHSAPLARIVRVATRDTILQEEPQSYGYRPASERAAPEVVTFQAEDGVEVAAQLFRPTGRGPHPALIYVHGGPLRQMFPAYHYSEYYARCYAFNRRLAQRGYLVLSINFRSGIGYGRAFREAENRGWRGAAEYQDVIAAARWLAARNDVDRKRIGIWGGSYGGLLTAQALARNSDVFAAGVSIHGVYDWSWPSARPSHLNPSRYFGVSDADRAAAFASSPLAFLDSWRSPVLLFSGDADMNVDVLETVDLTQKLRARGVPVETTLVPGEAHSFIRHATWLRLWREMAPFLDRRLRH